MLYAEIRPEEVYADAAASAVRLKEHSIVAAIDALLELNPPNSFKFEHWYNVGVLQYDAGLFEEAAVSFELAEESTDNRSDLADAQFNRGLTALRSADYTFAIQLFSAAIETDPSASMLVNRGNAFYASAEYDSALSDYLEAIELNQSYAEAHYNAGNIFYDRNELDQAYSAYSRAIRNREGFFEAYVNRGNISLFRGEYRAAAEDFRKAIELFPEDEDVAAQLDAAENILQQREAEGESN
ncbi:hypothetical protein JCM12856_12790 [Spirochaeta dissipatitropha]